MEGVVSKRLDSPYRPGQRHRDWTKTKNFRTQEVIVVGWKPGAGRRADRIGALLPAVNDERGRLSYAGHVGTGFTEASLEDLAERLTPLRQDDPPRTHPAAGRPRHQTLLGPGLAAGHPDTRTALPASPGGALRHFLLLLRTGSA
jgi:ATP-dependent DNA ligase